MESLIEPELPKSIGLLTNDQILLGPPMPAIDKLRIVSDSEYEDIVREWIAGYCNVQYTKVRRSSGSGDKGRDVVAFLDDNTWHNYQCKHYATGLMPSQIWLELGKLCYYTFVKDYTLPEKYFFVAPHGVGPGLAELLDKPDDLKKEFLAEWDKKCKDNIIAKTEIELSPDLKKHIDTIDFKIFRSIDPQEFIEQHKETNYFAARFGGGLNRRARPKLPPEMLEVTEVRYVEQLFSAYTQYLGTPIKSIGDLQSHTEINDHFNRQRVVFLLGRCA